ncbi:MAG: GAF and ANTAR domain-containing protein [Nocardioidaceae bacterium]|nr:GAF and ANTAR domain-containing protein [Nocardioidaceae bacterium]NUS49936.1 GAF and ANTAR domain-containing protein [Nocardioidaceae bacterium]
MTGSLDPTAGRPARLSGGDPATVFAALAQVVYAADDLDGVFTELCRTAPLVVPGVDHASLMLRRSGRFVTAAASDETARAIDGAEIELGDGPCVDAIDDDAAQFDPDLSRNSAWPRLAEWILANTPVRGSLGFRLKIDDDKVGALNLFSDTPGALTDVAIGEAAIFAAFASVAVGAAHHHERADTLRAGLESNREIGKAVGLMMAFHKIGDDEAFRMLRKASQELNLKLADVAREVLDHHRGR